jgi:hypothetical protein
MKVLVDRFHIVSFKLYGLPLSMDHHCTYIWRSIFGNGLKRSPPLSHDIARLFPKNVSAIDLIMMLARLVLVNSIHKKRSASAATSLSKDTCISSDPFEFCSLSLSTALYFRGNYLFEVEMISL